MFIHTLFESPIYFLRVIVILVFSICLHELSHGLAAISQGDNTPIKEEHMNFNPLVHMGIPSLIFLLLAGMAWGQMPVNPSKFRHPRWSSILVSAAGPLTNLGLGIVAILAVKFAVFTSLAKIISVNFLLLIAYFNFTLCLFNFLPIPPLDGFRITSEFFPELKSIENTFIGLVLLMILFTSDIGEMLFEISEFMIKWLT